jgi:hypothetical protein
MKDDPNLSELTHEIMSLAYDCSRIRLVIKMLDDYDQKLLAEWLNRARGDGTGCGVEIERICQLGVMLKAFRDSPGEQ